jgi:ferredoxin, 2Fe-2S
VKRRASAGVTLHEPIEEARRRAPLRHPPASRPTARIDFLSTMVKITFIDAAGESRTVEGEIGSTVMETAIKNGVPGIEAECGGACACSTCHVYIEEAWREKVGEPSPMEEDMLDFAFDVRPNSRLSCQIKVRDELDGLTVRTPERQA